MEQHPIPQDVTGFQFRIIGSMTVKQFAYVAFGVIAAVVLYYIPLPGFLGFLLKLFFIPLLGGSGFAIAFLPIEGRPIDLMAANFFKALFTPNQYVYHKAGRHLATATRPRQSKPIINQQPAINKEEQLQKLLQGAHIQTHTKLDDKEQLFFRELTTTPLGTQTTLPEALQQNVVPASQPLPQAPIQVPEPIMEPAAISSAPVSPPAMQPTATPPNLQEEQQNGTSGQSTTIQQDSVTPIQTPTPDPITLLEQQLKDAQQKNQLLEDEITKLKTQSTIQPQQQPATPKTEIIQQQPQQPIVQQPPIQYVRNIPKELLQQAGLTHLPDVPNVAMGIVKDSRGNVLPNILVEIKDTQGNPVRAFKTNPLGQFASATPLAQGVYTIALDDPKKQHTFDIIQFTANNQIMLPIEIISHDARENLRKELFS